MRAYHNLVRRVFDEGVDKEDRTGVGTLAIMGHMFEHEMSEGFPLLTTKKVPLKLVASELEFFVKGLTDKKWLQERKNGIWNEWCNPEKVPYVEIDQNSKQTILQITGKDFVLNEDLLGLYKRSQGSIDYFLRFTDKEGAKKISKIVKSRWNMFHESDLGPVYGFQWRYLGAEYKGCDVDYTGKGEDQLAEVINSLRANPIDRGMIVDSWNPLQKHQMALRPCHYTWQVTVMGDKLNLAWVQRSVDIALGLPFNIASYALLLHLLAKESGLKEGKLVGHLIDVHIYNNHKDGLREQLERKPSGLPKIETPNFSSIFDWEYIDTEVKDYKSHPAIKFDIAV